MFVRKISLRLYETDATGVLYFPQQLRMAQETFECFLHATGNSLGESLREEKYLMPVVHAEADFIKPLRVGDEIEIQLTLEKLGTSSFTLLTQFILSGGILAGKTSIVHVVIDRAAWRSTPIPLSIKESLLALAPVVAGRAD